jgi:hypothetical protein
MNLQDDLINKYPLLDQDLINKYPYRSHHAWACACARQASAE